MLRSSAGANCRQVAWLKTKKPSAMSRANCFGLPGMVIVSRPSRRLSRGASIDNGTPGKVHYTAMKWARGSAALLVLATMTASCTQLKIFEDVGSDPHPPSVAVTELVHFVAPPSEPTPEPTPDRATSVDSVASNQQGRSVAWDSGGFTLATGELFQIRVAYTDAGGDIVKFQLRDRDGSLKTDLMPVDQTYYSGTSGTVLCPATAVDATPAGIEITGVFGPHRLELWAEDSHGSRSEKVEFVITLTL